MEIVNVKLTDITPYEKNPRKNDPAVTAVANSIKEFGFKQPIVLDAGGVIIAGHTRYKAAKKLKIKTVPVVYATDLTEEQVKAYRLADNKTGELAEWDFDALADELAGITDLDMALYGFIPEDPAEMNEEPEEEEIYTTKIGIPQYEITGACPTLGDLVNMEKTESLIREIEASGVSEEEKTFLIAAAQRHNAFNYRNVAEYYAHADKEMQELMEASALVIIDYEDALKNGYVKLSSGLEALMGKTDEEEE